MRRRHATSGRADEAKRSKARELVGEVIRGLPRITEREAAWSLRNDAEHKQISDKAKLNVVKFIEQQCVKRS